MSEIENLWNSCVINSTMIHQIADIANTILKNYLAYQAVGNMCKLPAYIVGCLHYRESNFDFTKWLCNGDPLCDAEGNPIKTIHVPTGLGPANAWSTGALESLEYVSFNKNHHWDLYNALDNLERWNGLGYRQLNIPSPYLWSGTNVYTSGKFGRDGKYNPDLVDEQMGCAAILKSLEATGLGLNIISLQQPIN